MEQKHGGLMKFLNSETQNHMRDLPVQRIEIDNIVTNPRNFYGMREIDQLAGMIAMSHFVEPLVVRKTSDNQYMLVAGHRRLAAWKKLLESGEETDRTLPCYVREFKDMTITHADGTTETFKAEQLEFFYLMLSNRGQRQERTVEEQLREIRELEPLAKAIWKQKSEDNEYAGNFRKYFAEEVLTISPAKLQRKLALANLTPKALEALESGKISETAAVGIAKLAPEKQDEYIDDIMNGKASAKISQLHRELSRRDGEETEEELDDTDEELDDSEEEFDDAEEDNGEDSQSEEQNSDIGDTEPEGETTGEPETDEQGYSESVEENTDSVDSNADNRSETPVYHANDNTSKDNSKKNKVITLYTDVPIASNIENPKQEGNDFVINAMAPALDALIQSIEESKQRAEDEGRSMEALQWDVRLSVAKVKAAQFRQPV